MNHFLPFSAFVKRVCLVLKSPDGKGGHREVENCNGDLGCNRQLISSQLHMQSIGSGVVRMAFTSGVPTLR